MMHSGSRLGSSLSFSRAAGAAVGAFALTVSMGACSSGGSPKPAPSSVAAPKISVAPDLASNAKLGLMQPVDVSVTNGTITKVTVTDAKGAVADGSFSPAQKTWEPNTPLLANHTYTVTAAAKGAAGTSQTSTRQVTTDAGASTTAIYMSDPGKITSVGNAQPVVVTFTQPVPLSQRQEIEARLKVTDTAHVEGAWRWLNSARVDYRPKTFWPLHDKVTASGDLKGLTIGTTRGGGRLSAAFSVDTDLQGTFDRAKRRFTVTQGGKTVKTFLADGGKRGLETPSGSMVVLGKMPSVHMTSCSVGLGCSPSDPEYYDETIPMAVQLTPSGIFVHAAPWDTQLGAVDSSHGCIHLSRADATWFYQRAIPGVLVKVTGTINPVKVTNGDGDWNLSWAQWTS